MTSPIILRRLAASPRAAFTEAIEWTALWRRCVPDMAATTEGKVMHVRMPLTRPQDVLTAHIVRADTERFINLVDELRGDQRPAEVAA
jgi:hypothetical protein